MDDDHFNSTRTPVKETDEVGPRNRHERRREKALDRSAERRNAVLEAYGRAR